MQLRQSSTVRSAVSNIRMAERAGMKWVDINCDIVRASGRVGVTGQVSLVVGAPRTLAGSAAWGGVGSP
jgi:hypothetical protein